MEALERSAAKKFIEYFGEDTKRGQGTLPYSLLLKSHENASLWVAMLDTEIVGFLCATKKSNSFHIEEVSVAYKHQGKGIGKTLIRNVLNVANNQNCSFVSLTTDYQIPWNRPFYERLGFTVLDVEECPPTLRETLLDEKKSNKDPDNRIGMISYI